MADRKRFAAAPKPKAPDDSDIDAYIQGGAGSDIGTRPRLPVKRLTFDLPEDTHRRFKAACAASGVKMGSELVSLVEARTAQLETES